MIGIIGAMQVEVEQLLAQMKETNKRTVSGVCYHQGLMAGVPCVVAQCGIGKVAAAVCAQTMLLLYKPQVVLCEGVAGGIGKDIRIGDVVIAAALVQHDMDTSAVGDPVGFISGLNQIQMKTSEPVSNVLVDCANKVYHGGVHRGVIATGDQFIADKERLCTLAKQFNAVACEMEGGAIAQVCCMAKVPFGVLRSISDNADDDAKIAYETFAASAAHKNTALLAAALPILNERVSQVAD
ncbi:5'-methylthioadenosine/adenosylhomocysteine nucleosidase [Caproicibacterium lactatifermentans]|jgi:adenosylhomocysteine nucleosidase|uniref:adenosylhomocysteine nucleosidase n=1 Tax=Caproicibacterium lactatifermentans TaxID=2666138 RepID=A0ABX6PVS5_9FIRM|nr:5'-methylthioadenosine/adenosylhomocysteine nucleosidase [Caproicibacterium lactatifermentans]QKO30406.1 5'-methylthioadenosine/adenosylhomocysteine nucleosidase [Caproicibacterium lactatifermentans]